MDAESAKTIAAALTIAATQNLEIEPAARQDERILAVDIVPTYEPIYTRLTTSDVVR